MTDRPIEVAIAVVEHRDRLLIGQRPTGVALAGYWEVPGGKLEPDESPADAAIRECREEYGFDATGPFVLSMARTPEDVRVVLAAADAEQLEPLDIAPLFETVDDIVNARDCPVGVKTLSLSYPDDKTEKIIQDGEYLVF